MSGTLQIGLDQQVAVKTNDGRTLWMGTAVMGVSYHMTNSDTAAMDLAEGVRFDFDNCIIPRLETSPAPPTLVAKDLPQRLALKCIRIASAVDTGFVGVALEPIKVGGVGLVAGIGCICTVLSDGNALGATGNPVGGSTTPGRVAQNIALAQILGNSLKTNQVFDGPKYTGSAAHIGILVSPR